MCKLQFQQNLESWNHTHTHTHAHRVHQRDLSDECPPRPSFHFAPACQTFPLRLATPLNACRQSIFNNANCHSGRRSGGREGRGWKGRKKRSRFSAASLFAKCHYFLLLPLRCCLNQAFDSLQEKLWRGERRLTKPPPLRLNHITLLSTCLKLS